MRMPTIGNPLSDQEVLETVNEMFPVNPASQDRIKVGPPGLVTGEDHLVLELVFPLRGTPMSKSTPTYVATTSKRFALKKEHVPMLSGLDLSFYLKSVIDEIVGNQDCIVTSVEDLGSGDFMSDGVISFTPKEDKDLSKVYIWQHEPEQDTGRDARSIPRMSSGDSKSPSYKNPERWFKVRNYSNTGWLAGPIIGGIHITAYQPDS